MRSFTRLRGLEGKRRDGDASESGGVGGVDEFVLRSAQSGRPGGGRLYRRTTSQGSEALDPIPAVALLPLSQSQVTILLLQWVHRGSTGAKDARGSEHRVHDPVFQDALAG